MHLIFSLSNLRKLKHRIRNYRDTNNLKGALVKLNRLEILEYEFMSKLTVTLGSKRCDYF